MNKNLAYSKHRIIIFESGNTNFKQLFQRSRKWSMSCLNFSNRWTADDVFLLKENVQSVNKCLKY